MSEETPRDPLSPGRLPPPDAKIGGRGYVRVRGDAQSGRQHLLPTDDEFYAEETARHYRRSSEVMARQIECGRVPWQRA